MEKYATIGTAGHVDHGKTQLIKALTGINTDRLIEEQKRGISIELGFAYLTLPDGKKVGIVDVPGHEKFVKQMLAGVGGIDAVLFVIAADEGIMPQTREHFDILNLLEIKKGIIVVTKIDIVDKDWLDLVEEDIRKQLKAGFLKDAPLCKVSSLTMEGIPELKKEILTLLSHLDKKKEDLPARMPIDRVFSMKGFGTVVTGTIKCGVFYKGQEVIIEPGGKTARIRNIQVHGDPVNEVEAGQRGALNLSGITVNEIKKGSTLVIPGYYHTGHIIDVELTNLPSEKRSIKHRQLVHFHLGTTEKLGRIHLLESEALKPGATQHAQIILEEPILAAPGDRFVIRFFSPVITIGGGKVLGFSAYKKKRFKTEIIKELEVKAKGNWKQLIGQVTVLPISLDEICHLLNYSKEETKKIIKDSLKGSELIVLYEDGRELYWNRQIAEKWQQKICADVLRYQRQHPLSPGMGREELKKAMETDLSLKRWQLILEWISAKGLLKISGNRIEPYPKPKLPAEIEEKLNCLLAAYEAAGLSPPQTMESAGLCAIPSGQEQEYLDYLCRVGKLVKIQDYYFSTSALNRAKKELSEMLKERKEITASEARERWQTSRKYTIFLLEYFDSINFTKRIGPVRRLYKEN
ncbi:MAG: selenocysteine-specific translation elongation factor [Peptococcaceae bacterium]|nr:selenocysteine-specific translation elongation factor [Peptococcaceae bacterium]